MKRLFYYFLIVLSLSSCKRPASSIIYACFGINPQCLDYSVEKYEDEWFISDGYTFIELSINGNERDSIVSFRKQMIQKGACNLPIKEKLLTPNELRQYEDKDETEGCYLLLKGESTSSDITVSSFQILILDEKREKLFLYNVEI